MKELLKYRDYAWIYHFYCSLVQDGLKWCPGEAAPCLAPSPLSASIPRASLLVSSPRYMYLLKKTSKYII